jgi:hypothetical protein
MRLVTSCIRPETERSKLTSMDEKLKQATAAIVYRYMLARAWFRSSKLPRTAAGVGVTKESLAEDMAQDRRLLGDGVLVYPLASPPIVGDDVDPDFLAAISGKDDAIEIDGDQLKKLRDFVLHDGDLPRRKHQTGSSLDRSPGG